MTLDHFNRHMVGRTGRITVGATYVDLPNAPRTKILYTIGLTPAYTHPEILLVGADGMLALDTLYCLEAKIRDGVRYKQGQHYTCSAAGELQFAFVPVLILTGKTLGIPCADASELNDSPELLQLVWPDHNNHLPWDAGCDPRVRDAQPLLSEIDHMDIAMPRQTTRETRWRSAGNGSERLFYAAIGLLMWSAVGVIASRAG